MPSGKVTSKKNGFFPAHSAAGKPILTDGVQMAVHPVRRVINVEPQHGQLIPGTARVPVSPESGQKSDSGE